MEQKEIVHEVVLTFEDNRYEIKVFDLNTMKSSGHFNILVCIKKESDVDRVLEHLPYIIAELDKLALEKSIENSKFSDKEKAQILKQLDNVVVTEQSNSSENKKRICTTGNKNRIVQKSITNFVVTVKKILLFLSRLLEDKLVDWFHKITHRKVGEGTITIRLLPSIGKARLVPWEELDKSDDNNKPITSTGNITNSVTPVQPTTNHLNQ